MVHHLLRTRVRPYAVEKDSFIGFYYSNGTEMDVVYKAEDASTLFIEVKYISLTPAVTVRTRLAPAFTVTKSDFSLSPGMMKIPAPVLLALTQPSPLITYERGIAYVFYHSESWVRSRPLP